MRKPRIGIDMRMAGEGFGIGRYITELVSALLELPKVFDYVLFFDRNFSIKPFEIFSKKNTECRLLDIPYYSIAEQTKLPITLSRENLDLMHFPNFNVPLIYPKKFIVTIHDLIHHHVPGKKRTHFLHRLAYKAIINSAARRARKIIAVSETTKNDIIKTLGINSEKVAVIYEGVSDAYRITSQDKSSDLVKEKFGINRPYFLWVGVWRKYKNLPLLARVFKDFNASNSNEFQLVLVGEPDLSYPEIGRQVMSESSGNSIIATGKIIETELIALMRGATAYVNPSRLEGFMLPSLEAQACGTPVLSSDIPVAREIHGDSADYFDITRPDSLARLLEKIARNTAYRGQMSGQSILNAQKFSWKQTAEKTLNLYQTLV